MERPDIEMTQISLNPVAARRLSNTTKSIPMMESISPRWLLKFLPWVPVEAGVYRVNRIRKSPRMEDVNEYGEKLIDSNYQHINEEMIPQTFVDYEEQPREYMLNLVQTILRMNTNVTDIFNKPIDQKNEQIRLTIEAMKEKQESELINDPEFGLVNNVSHEMRTKARHGSPSPDDMDDLLAKVWKKPAFFLAHPKAISAFGRECTRRGVPPVVVNIYGSPFMTWRGVPMIPCDKLMVGGKSYPKSDTGRTNILLLRIGEKEQGVIGLHQPGIPDETDVPSLSVKLAHIDQRGIASYILSLYFSIAVLADDALGMMEDVEVGNYYDYR